MGPTEDEVASAIIENTKEKWESEGVDRSQVGIYPEAHYNNYGKRGVADLYLKQRPRSGSLIEIKSESAVKEATGANEIIRQFNKMRENFFEGSNHEIPEFLHFALYFTVSEHNFRHISNNREIYRTVPNQQMDDVYDTDTYTTISMRTADSENSNPIAFFSSRTDGFDRGLAEYINKVHPEVYKKHQEVIEEISTE